jgi:hypothetical protein
MYNKKRRIRKENCSIKKNEELYKKKKKRKEIRSF